MAFLTFFLFFFLVLKWKCLSNLMWCGERKAFSRWNGNACKTCQDFHKGHCNRVQITGKNSLNSWLVIPCPLTCEVSFNALCHQGLPRPWFAQTLVLQAPLCSSCWKLGADILQNSLSPAYFENHLETLMSMRNGISQATRESSCLQAPVIKVEHIQALSSFWRWYYDLWFFK